MEWTISGVLKQGLRLWKQRWGSWLLVVLLTIALPLIPHFASKFVSEQAVVSQYIFMLLAFILSIMADIGFTTLALKSARGENWVISDYFSRLHLFAPYFVASVLYQLAVAVGMVLLLIPGIFAIVRLSLYRYCVLDQGLQGYEALKMSNSLVEGCSWRMLTFLIMSFVLFLLGALLFGVGLFIMIPIINLAWSTIYLNRLEPKGV